MPSTSTEQSNPQGRYWLATIKAEDWTPNEAIIGETILYAKGQQEIGAGGFNHYQVVFVTKRIRRTALKRLLCQSAHLEISRSQAANDYVWKDETAVEGTRFEYGTMPFKRNSKVDWKDVKEKAKCGNLEEIDDGVFISHYRTLKQIAIDFMNRPDDLNEACGIWIYGPPGTGKSHYARQHYGSSLYMKAQNKWWCGYQNEENVLLDDLDTNVLGHHLKIWADKYAFMAEAKGSCRLIRPKRFIITSNYSIEALFGADPVLVAAIERRFYKIYLPMRMY